MFVGAISFEVIISAGSDKNSFINFMSFHLIPICVIIAMFELPVNDEIHDVDIQAYLTLYLFMSGYPILHQLNVSGMFCHLYQYWISITNDNKNDVWNAEIPSAA